MSEPADGTSFENEGPGFAAETEAVAAAQPTPVPEPAPAAIPMPQPAPTPAPQPAPVPEPVPAPQPVPELSSAPGWAAPAWPTPAEPYPAQPFAAPQPIDAPPVPDQRPTRRQQPVNGFTIAGLVLAILAIIVALWRFGDNVSVFGVVGLALGIIGWFYTKDQATTRGEKPSVFNRAIVIVVLVLSIAALILTPISNYYQRSQLSSYYGGYYSGYGTVHASLPDQAHAAPRA